jgi:ribonucleotide reductase alpha subunit
VPFLRFIGAIIINMGPQTEFSERLHATKYRLENESFNSFSQRFSRATCDNGAHYGALLDIISDQRFLPAGRVQAAMGSPHSITAHNCFVGKVIEDDMESIMEELKNSALTLRMGGGCGWDFSTIRPEGFSISTMNARSSGPISFMDMWNSMCKTIMAQGLRRGAMMGVLRVDHPDILKFINAKQDQQTLNNFNISVAITDAFMKALKDGSSYELMFNGIQCGSLDARTVWNQIMRNTWDWAEPGVLFIDTINKMNPLSYCEKIAATNPCLAEGTLVSTPKGLVPIERMEIGDRIKTVLGTGIVQTIEKHKNVPVFLVKTSCGVQLKATAAHIFHTLAKERKDGFCNSIRLCDLSPGDNIRVTKDVSPHETTTIESIDAAGTATVYDLYEPISDTWVTEGIVNRGCGEQPLPASGACLLGSFNMVKYLTTNKLSNNLKIDMWKFSNDISHIVRAMDNVIDRSKYPLESQRLESINKRRMGLGVTGIANALELLGLPYGSNEYIGTQERILSTLRNIAYFSSSEIAKEKGSFPLFDYDKWIETGFAKTLPEGLKVTIKKYGLRNGLLLSIAPTGTISLCADNVSSGIEPPYMLSGKRIMNLPNGKTEVEVKDWAYQFHDFKCRTAEDITAEEHVKVLCSAQKYIDSAVSKTCNVGDSVSFEEFKNIYVNAYYAGAKGCTTFRRAGKRFGIMNPDDKPEENKEVGAACYFDPNTGEKSCSA